MNNIADIKTKLSQLRDQEKTLCAVATETVKREIVQTREELRLAEITLLNGQRPVFDEIAGIISEMAAIAFRLSVFHAWPAHFEIKAHIQSVSVRNIDGDDEYSGRWFSYMTDKGEPTLDRMKTGLTYMREVLEKFEQDSAAEKTSEVFPGRKDTNE